MDRQAYLFEQALSTSPPCPCVRHTLIQLDALTMNEPTQDSKTILSPRKPKVKPGPRKQPVSSIPYKFAKPVATPSRQEKTFTTEFMLGALAWWEHARIEDCARYGLKHVRYLNRWRKALDHCCSANTCTNEPKTETLLLMKPTQRRHRPSIRLPKLEKALVAAFVEHRKDGKTVRRRWFERTVKAFFLQLCTDI